MRASAVRLVYEAASSSCSMIRLAFVKLSSSTTVDICSSTQEISMTKLTMKTETPMFGAPLGSNRSSDSSHEPPPGCVRYGVRVRIMPNNSRDGWKCGGRSGADGEKAR
jgi:hypothetical protein